uniref:Capsid protein n=1 Tax=Geladintestivirus 1 TaxID=3233133 RepID=A0AAU8MI50_9CAUD
MTAEEKKAKADALMAKSAEVENVEVETVEVETEKPQFVSINGFKFKAEVINRAKVHIKGLKYKMSENEDTAGVFIFQTKEKVWGTYLDSDMDETHYTSNASSFPASDWGIIPTLRQDTLLRNIVDDMIISSLTDGAEFDREYGHKFDDVELDIIQIYVPAHTEFINPYTTSANPVGRSYEKDYVFTFIEGFKYNIKNINHKQFLKDIYDGCPRMLNGVLENTTRPFSISPIDFVESLADFGYFGKIDEKQIERLAQSISYKR